MSPGGAARARRPHARCRLPVALIAITRSPACAASNFSSASIPDRAAGNETGSSSRPVPLLTQTRFITFPTTTVAGSRANLQDVRELPPCEPTRPESTQLQLTTYQLGPANGIAWLPEHIRGMTRPCIARKCSPGGPEPDAWGATVRGGAVSATAEN